MKTSFYVLLLVLLAISCNSDDDGAQNNEPTLHGQWSLINVSGGFAGIDDDYESDIIIWDFNQDTQEITVTNTNIELIIYDGLPSGVYDYDVITTQDTSTITIEGIDFEITTLTNSQLILDQGVAADGFLLRFIR